MSNLASKCAKCGQTVAGSAPKSFTAWLFRPAECNCDRSLIGVTNTPAPPGAASLPGREDQDATLTGQTIAARYEVLALLGRGGMGTVYKVRDHDSGSILALKVISDRLSDPEAYERRLAQEASAVKALTHRNIVALKGAGKTDQGTPFLVMDFVPGKSLDALMQAEGGVNLDQAIDIFVQIAEALDHAHAKGIVHRDLKPGNILLLEDGSGTYCVKIIDFGIAKICDHPGEDKTKLTQTGELMGSPQYMSPEQCRGDHLDARSDIYSLGCTMYEVLSGRPPFAGENPVRVILKHLSEPPERWTKDGRVDADLQNLVLRCLAKDPADRYQSAALLLHDLRQIEQGKRLWAVRFIGTRQRVRQIIGACIATLLLGFLIVPGYLPKSEHPGAQPEPSHRGGDGGGPRRDTEPQKDDKDVVAVENKDKHRSATDDETAIEAVERSAQGKTTIDLSNFAIAYNVTDADLRPIKDNRVAIHVNLKGLTAITDKGLENLSHLHLQRLVINNTPVADLHAIKDMVTLKELFANGTNLNAKGVEVILGLKNLERLGLASTPLTDPEVSALARLKLLKQLDLKGCPNVSRAAVKRLRMKLSACSIDYDLPQSSEDNQAEPSLELSRHLMQGVPDRESAAINVENGLKVPGISAQMREALLQEKAAIGRKTAPPAATPGRDTQVLPAKVGP